MFAFVRRLELRQIVSANAQRGNRRAQATSIGVPEWREATLTLTHGGQAGDEGAFSIGLLLRLLIGGVPASPIGMTAR